MSDDERAMTSVEPPVEERSTIENLRLGGGAALVAALVLFFAQNFGEANVNFLWFDWELPLVFALLISALFGALATWLFTTLRGRAERKRQEAIFDSAMREAKQ
jgi:uncharacterized integral membrane protein